jgi:predicted nucleic acid-binding protein
VGASAVTAELLFDASAWVRSNDEAIDDLRAYQVAEYWESGALAVCLPFLLEAGYTAQSARDHGELLEELLSLPLLGIDEVAERRAIDVQSQLARIGHHRIAPVDVMIAAIAERHGVGVLHYDSDYDLLLEKTDLEFQSEWLMPRGSLN